MDFTTSLYELIDMRSFSNLWFWIALAVLWSTTAHWILGVPFDMITRARREGGQIAADVADLVRVNVTRLLYISEVSGLWLIGILFFYLTSLVLLGFIYWVEFAQALFLLSFPMTLVGIVSLRLARRISGEGLEGEELYKRLVRHRIVIQVIGMISIFVTAMWGMYTNLSLGVL